MEIADQNETKCNARLLHSVAIAAVVALLLSACTVIDDEIEDPALAQPPVAAEKQPKMPSALGGATLPTQIGYSFNVLNQPQISSEFPQIVDLQNPDTALLTPEERRKLEEELRLLNAQNEK